MGDKPKVAKKNLVHFQPSDSDSDDSAGDLECETCGVSFSNGKAYESHMQGKKHQRKVAEAKLMAKNLAAAGKKSDDDEDDDDDDDDSNMYCDVCDKSFSGYMSYSSHIKGNVHAKAVKKQKLEKKLGNMPEVLDKNGKDDDGGTDEDEDLLPKPYARCNTCQKEFSGVESYDMHMKSAAHKKKMAMENLKAKYQDEANKSDGEEPFSKCDVCQKSFSGVLPYKVHMLSSVHKKNLEKKKVAEEMKEFYVEDSGYVCKECKKAFKDPVAFKCHLQKNSHEKQKAKSALKEFLNAHPEIVFVFPLADDGSGKESDDDDNANSNYYLICKLCNVSFSGPESAQDHVKSKKHLNVKKEKKLMKILKEQKKNSEVKSTEEESKDSKSDKSSANGTSTNDKSKSPKDSSGNHEHDFELI